MGNNKVSISAASTRGGRVFIATFLALIGYSLTAAASGLSSVPINLSDPKKTLIAISVCFVVGFLGGAGKFIRDKYGDPSGGGKINAIPI